MSIFNDVIGMRICPKRNIRFKFGSIVFVGDAYGWGGNSAVILGSVIYGVYNGLFLSVINIFKKNYWTFAFFIYVATHFTGVMTSFNLVLFSTHMILTGIVVFLFAGPFRFSVKRLNDGY